MNTDQVVALLAEANPVPDVAAVDTIERVPDVRLRTTDVPELRPVGRASPRPRQPRFRIGPVLAGLAAVVLLVLGTTLWPPDRPDVASDIEVAEAEEMAERIAAAVTSGRIDDVHALFDDPVVTSGGFERDIGIVDWLNWHSVLGTKLEALECEGASRGGAVRVHCGAMRYTNVFTRIGPGSLDETVVYLVEDGRIVEWEAGFSHPVRLRLLANFYAWVHERHPELLGRLVDVALPGEASSDRLIVTMDDPILTEESARLHVQYVGLWKDEGRPELVDYVTFEPLRELVHGTD